MGPFHDGGQFLVIHRLRAEMHLELESVAFAGLDAGHGRFPCSRDTAEGIVLLRVERIDADARRP